jgi:2-dehydropantoate 2-reductase
MVSIMGRIAILGAGAIGSTLGAFLRRSRQDVTLIGREEHIQCIRRQGLQVDGALGTLSISLPASTVLDFRPDFAFLTVKTQDVLPTIQSNIGFLADVPLVTFQNGVRSDELVATLLPESQIISCVVNLGATFLNPGKITVIYPGSLLLGRPFSENDPLVGSLASVLSAVTITGVSHNIKGAHWLKLIVNLNNALPALINLTLPQVFEDPFLRTLAVKVMREGLQTVRQAGIKLESLPDTSVGLIRLMDRLPESFASFILAAVGRRRLQTGELLGSTLQSLRRGRPTEIDYLNGEVVRLGRQQNLATPLNEAIVDMVHQVERSGQFLSSQEIRSRIADKV